MKKAFISFLFSITAGIASIARVGINADGTLPDPSALVDVKSASKGALLPRMTASQRNLIASPTDGLMVFCTNCGTDGSGVLCIYSNGAWTTLRPCNTPEVTTVTPFLSPGQCSPCSGSGNAYSIAKLDHMELDDGNECPRV